MDNPIFVQTPNNNGITFENADGIALKDLITGAVNGTKVIQIPVVNDDIDHIMELHWSDGVNDFIISSRNIFSLTGTNGNPLSLIDTQTNPWLQIDNNGNPFIWLKENEKLKVKPQVIVTAAKLVTVTVFAQDF